jgi:hypothetical protein
MLFTETVAVYSENHVTVIKTQCGQNTKFKVKECGIYSNHCASSNILEHIGESG